MFLALTMVVGLGSYAFVILSLIVLSKSTDSFSTGALSSLYAFDWRYHVTAEGRKGFIAFTPYYMVTEGTLYEQVIDVDTGDSSTPKARGRSPIINKI